MKGERIVDMSENRRTYSDNISLKVKNVRKCKNVREKVKRHFGKGKNWEHREIC